MSCGPARRGGAVRCGVAQRAWLADSRHVPPVAGARRRRPWGTAPGRPKPHRSVDSCSGRLTSQYACTMVARGGQGPPSGVSLCARAACRRAGGGAQQARAAAAILTADAVISRWLRYSRCLPGQSCPILRRPAALGACPRCTRPRRSPGRPDSSMSSLSSSGKRNPRGAAAWS